MREDNLHKYKALLESRENQKAHQLAHRAFSTYKSQLAGSKYLLQMLVQLPILSQCSAAQSAFAPVPALTKWIADLQEHKQTPEYQAAVALSKKRSSEHGRLSHQIWQQTRELAKAKALARKARLVSMNVLTLEEQDLVKAYDGGCLEQNLQNLLSQKPSAYRGVAACVSDLQNGQRWCRPVSTACFGGCFTCWSD